MTTGVEASLVVAPSTELGRARFARVDALCEEAFGHPFAAIWSSVGSGTHVVAEANGKVVGHAMLVERAMHVGRGAAAHRLRTGYVENVATQPAIQGQGIGSLIMRRIGELIAERFVIGGLATGSNPFYARLGWETWTGPTFVRTDRGDVRTAQHDGHVMLLRVAATPPLAGDEPISIGWRPGEIW